MKILIVVIVLIGLIAVLGPFIVGKAFFDGIVIDHPYERGLAWDETRREKAALGWRVIVEKKDFVIGENAIVFSVLDRNGGPVADAGAEFVLSRPSTIAYDRGFPVEKKAEGSYQALVQMPLYGNWDLRITVTKEGRRVLFEERIFVKKGDS